MYWHRLECSSGRFSLMGTTVQAAERLPRHLVADEAHHANRQEGLPGYGRRRVLPGDSPGRIGRQRRPGGRSRRVPGRGEALGPGIPPETVNTDGWPATQAAWRPCSGGHPHPLFPPCVPEDPDRAKHLKETFDTRGSGLGRITPRMPARPRNGLLPTGVGRGPRRQGGRPVKVLALCDKWRRSPPPPIPAAGGRATR
ncbi:MAG: hypothetical protein WKF75_06265 [Singulisphaera sp.]